MLYLGCPIWTSKQWPGRFLPSTTPARDALSAYSRRLNMVEGNTTFYGMPSLETVARWRDETPPEFRFCLKFPRTISHDKALADCETETNDWLDRLTILGERAGPSFLQLSSEFGPDRLPILTRFLTSLPRDMAFSVEPRHPGWFSEQTQTALNTLLSDLGIARVIYDVRPLRAADMSDPDVVVALQKKPNVPVRTARTAKHTLVRYISHPDVATNEPWLRQWQERVRVWLEDGTDVYFCMHSIHDRDMPTLCREFYEGLMSDGVALPPLPEWTDASERAQMSLF